MSDSYSLMQSYLKAEPAEEDRLYVPVQHIRDGAGTLQFNTPVFREGESFNGEWANIRLGAANNQGAFLANGISGEGNATATPGVFNDIYKQGADGYTDSWCFILAGKVSTSIGAFEFYLGDVDGSYNGIRVDATNIEITQNGNKITHAHGLALAPSDTFLIGYTCDGASGINRVITAHNTTTVSESIKFGDGISAWKSVVDEDGEVKFEDTWFFFNHPAPNQHKILGVYLGLQDDAIYDFYPTADITTMYKAWSRGFKWTVPAISPNADPV